MLIKFLGRSAAVLLVIISFSGCSSISAQKTAEYTEDLYRRIQYKTEGPYRVINLFYATTRKVSEGEFTPQSFQSELAQNLTYGALNVKVSPSIKIGTVIPDKLKEDGLIGIQNIGMLGENEFMRQLSDAVALSPHNSLMVLVFGYKDDFEETVIKASYFSYLVDINTPVLLFDWPGDQPPSIPGYAKAQEYAVASGSYLGELLVKIIRQVKPAKLWVNASSLGCQIVCDAFDSMYKYPDISDVDNEIDHVILAAPDVAQNEFDEKFKTELAAISRKLTTYVSSDDEALLMSGIINQDERVGRIKIKPKESAQLEELKELLYVKSLDSDRVSLVDVTPINNASFKHGYYLESPEFYDDFYLRIFNKEPNVNRRLYLIKFKGNTDYWVLRPGR